MTTPRKPPPKEDKCSTPAAETAPSVLSLEPVELLSANHFSHSQISAPTHSKSEYKDTSAREDLNDSHLEQRVAAALSGASFRSMVAGPSAGHRWRVSKEFSLMRRYSELSENDSVRFLVDRMREFYEEFVASKRDKYWHRKSGQIVLSVLLLRHQGQLRYTRGINSELSLPSGSICAERAAIASALTQFLSLTQADFVSIAVLGVRGPEPNPIRPCGVCNEWIKKLEQRSPTFTVVTFLSLDMDEILEQCPVTFIDEVMDDVPPHLKGHWICSCGFQYNLSTHGCCSQCAKPRFQSLQYLSSHRIQILQGLILLAACSKQIQPLRCMASNRLRSQDSDSFIPPKRKASGTQTEKSSLTCSTAALDLSSQDASGLTQSPQFLGQEVDHKNWPEANSNHDIGRILEMNPQSFTGNRMGPLSEQGTPAVFDDLTGVSRSKALMDRKACWMTTDGDVNHRAIPMSTLRTQDVQSLRSDGPASTPISDVVSESTPFGDVSGRMCPTSMSPSHTATMSAEVPEKHEPESEDADYLSADAHMSRTMKAKPPASGSTAPSTLSTAEIKESTNAFTAEAKLNGQRSILCGEEQLTNLKRSCCVRQVALLLRLSKELVSKTMKDLIRLDFVEPSSRQKTPTSCSCPTFVVTKKGLAFLARKTQADQ